MPKGKKFNHHLKDMGRDYTITELAALMPDEWELELKIGHQNRNYYRVENEERILTSPQFQNVLFRAWAMSIVGDDVKWERHHPQKWIRVSV